MNIHICPGPSVVIARREDDRPTRWCFRCRKHLVHIRELLDDPPERQPSYYEPIWVRRCSGCHEATPHSPILTTTEGPHAGFDRVHERNHGRCERADG